MNQSVLTKSFKIKLFKEFILNKNRTSACIKNGLPELFVRTNCLTGKYLLISLNQIVYVYCVIFSAK